ncbi:serine hydrolase domain-containing protein [Sphingomonas sp. 1P08PE]|uniref:serine hydrolase domain-containing protein n=1 Tax=Sphingomonas sp. 1P08PE TaxID=554122 RepID=UPI0039A08E10
MIRFLLPIAAALAAPAPAATRPAPAIAAMEPRLTALFQTDMRDRHIPGLVYGIVSDGRLVLVRGLGVQDVDTRRPVTADTRFRIASMSKAFTALAILKLRDEGKLSLEAPAERYVPEMARWRYPTTDSPHVRVADLLHHTAGYVEDNPWGDRQQPLSEPAFTSMLAAGVPFAQAPGLGMEYSNFGYATLGRIVSNVGGAPYQDWITRAFLGPLGMTSTGYDVLTGPQAQRALGYRWQDGAWLREPDMADGAFGAMGGLQTTANDYARWVAFLLSGWPARDGADDAPVRRSTVRGIVEGANFVAVRDRYPALGTACRQPVAYAKGWFVIGDCDLGRVVTHTGGYPGYGSVVALLPDAGIGIFAFANRTYAAPSVPAMQALLVLHAAGLATPRALAVSSGLAAAYDAARAAWRRGDAAAAPLAGNVLLDRSRERRRAEIAELGRTVGRCPMTEPIVPVSAMEGRFVWTCDTGKVAGRVQRAPTPSLSLQVLDFAPAS